MAWNPARVRKQLQNRNFAQLFIEELGWDNLRQRLTVVVDGAAYPLESVAHKRGVVVFVHRAEGDLPDSRIRRKIESQVALSHREHILIYTDGPGNEQIWQWVRREPGKPLSNREHRYHNQQSGESLLQKLEAIRFSLDEEDDLTLTDVVGNVRAAFNVERATKKFYTEFKREHDAFQKFLAGIPDDEMERWYVSVMLNRLMFLYFIQKKGFLAGDTDYLRSKLTASQSQGADRYYRDFLCPLFFDGFAKPTEKRTPAIRLLLGDIPYLNGGIFQQHQVEQIYGRAIAVPDRAFDRLFDFFDSYRWHLDDRPLRDDREINPDVLGYIFEQYINQKQMGAYYTKEDITDYIGKNTIIPFLFDRAQQSYPDGFRGANGAWTLLSQNPDRYIYPAVGKGADLPLPAEIAAGLDDVSQRGQWNTPAAAEFVLPTEIWRETVARRQRYAEVKRKLAQGEIQSINDLITLNLDMRQFAQDVIEQTDRPELVRAFWAALIALSVLDPTCGSGAFLFAALNILEPLYEACLARMQGFVDEIGPEESSRRFKDFRTELEKMARHPSQKYFIYKSIVVNNLYGVDIMAEATEIAKLRLFLKLVAQVDDVSKLEPLPDIDFNIRAGNTLVGFATYDDVETTVRGDKLLLLPEDEELLAEIREEAEAVERLFGRFRKMQTSHDVSEWGEDYATAKGVLTQRLRALDERLNRLLAQQYGVNPGKLEYDAWRTSHQPFHWFVEFYGILKAGGFDVIIGNPPYVVARQISSDYALINYQTESCGNLYAFVSERSMQFLTANGRLGFIIPVASVCTDGFSPLQKLFRASDCLTISSFNDRPGKLFDGLEHIRLSIVLFQNYYSRKVNSTYTTTYNKWQTSERSHLFDLLSYTESSRFATVGSIPKLGTGIERNILQKVLDQKRPLEAFTTRRGNHPIYYTRKLSYFVQILDFVPRIIDSKGMEREPSELKVISFDSEQARDAFLAVLNSSLFYWYLTVYSDCRNLNRREVYAIPFDFAGASSSTVAQLSKLAKLLMDDYQSHSELRTMNYRQLGTLTIQCVFPKLSKPIIDQIDAVLARHYGFSDEELDYILNYDIKYRMGDELFSEEEE